jgi:hypothetical protein
MLLADLKADIPLATVRIHYRYFEIPIEISAATLRRWTLWQRRLVHFIAGCGPEHRENNGEYGRSHGDGLNGYSD